jgi:CRP-like cAMP-binding protein
MEKIKQALEEARRQRQDLETAAATPNVVLQQLAPVIEARIRRLTPINQLPMHYQDVVIREGEIISFPRGSRILVEGSKDEYVHYLVDGTVGILIGGQTAKHLSVNSGMSTFPLDEPGKAREVSVTAENAVRVFRLKHAVLQREVNLAITAPPGPPPEVMDIDNGMDISNGDTADWIVVMLRAGLFANLPVESIQHILARVEELEVEKRQVIIEQDGPADFFYLIKRGTAEVVRKASPDSVPAHLADIGPGDGFGEEALIANARRNATVTMTSDGELLKVQREDFNTLIRDPLLKDVSLDEAGRFVSDGARWIDARYAEQFAAGAMPDAISVPLPLLRRRCRELDPANLYIVYSDDASASAAAAFLLSARGLDARYVNETVRPPLTEPADDTSTPAGTRDEEVASSVDAMSFVAGDQDESRRSEDMTDVAPVQPEFYADTRSGQKLADLVEEIHSDHQQIAKSAKRDPTEETAGQTNMRLGESLFNLELDSFDSESLPAHGEDAEPGDVTTEQTPDPIGSAFRELEKAVRGQIDAVRKDERDRIEQYVRSRVARIRKRAERMMREKLLEVRARDRERNKAAENRLRQQYEKLTRLANKITHQKAEIQRARRQLEQKLRAADQIHRELAELGLTMTQELDNLEGMMPDGDTKFSA